MAFREGEAVVHQGLPPVVDRQTRVLILGSLPGSASLAAGQYYAHPRNDFWRLIGSVINHDLEAFAYLERLEILRASGLGLWDVIACAERSGSLDSAIRLPKATDLLGLAASLPKLRAVAFNGGTAARLGTKILAPDHGRLRMMSLPSSSSAYTRPFTEKADAWAEIRSALAG